MVSAWMRSPKKPEALVAFRIAFGAMMAVSALRFLYYGWAEECFSTPKFTFKYWGFHWVTAFGPSGMKGVFVTLFFLALCVAAGLFYRASIVLFGIVLAYVFLIDVTNYLNHYYLVLLLTTLLGVMPLGRAYSLDVWRKPSTRLSHFPAWCTYVLRAQVGLVYFFAGVAKMKSDWLMHAEPLKIWLLAHAGDPVWGSLLGHSVTPVVFSWAGCLFDTTIPFWLLWKKSRKVAYLAVLAFHACTQWLFPIGMFPSIMVVSALVFFEADWPLRVYARMRRPRSIQTLLAPVVAPTHSNSNDVKRWGLVSTSFAALYFAIQVALPLRHFLYPGDVLWHEQGMRFAWHVMVREKNGSVTYDVVDKTNGHRWEETPETYLTDRQLRDFSTQPDLILALGQHIGDVARKSGHSNIAVYARTSVSLNGRRPATLVDPAADLLSCRDGVGPFAWVSKTVEDGSKERLAWHR